MKRITAKFTGKNGSEGYVNGRKYSLVVYHNLGGYISIKKSSDIGGYCIYSTIVSFLDNWTEITVYS